MASDRKKITVQYRRLDDVTGGFQGRSLQTAIEEAMNYSGINGRFGDHPQHRAYEETPTYGTTLLNKFETNNNLFFGKFVKFEPGAQLPLLGMMPNGNSYNLVQAPAPNGHEAAQGILYFMAIKNHLIVIQGEISTSRLEKYLRWLLVSAQVIPPAATVILAAEIELADGTARLANIDQITFQPHTLRGSEISQSSMQSAHGAFNIREHDIVGMRTTDVLKAAGMESADIHELINNKTDIEITLQIKFKDGRQKKSLNLDHVGRLFRNVEPENLTFYGPGGRQTHDRLVKLARTEEILTDGSLLDTRDVMRALFKAYEFFVSRGHIDP